MNDFLRNLRSAHKKNPSDPKRNLDGHYYPQTERRHIRDRRSNYSENLEDLFRCLKEDFLVQIADNASVMTRLLEKIQVQDSLRIEAQIRQHNAVAVFFDSLNRLISSSEFSTALSSDDSKDKPEITASYASGTRYTKDEILSIIRTMRNQGSTFAAIAEYLEKKSIPTFSGRGKWHAQTIHRLCR